MKSFLIIVLLLLTTTTEMYSSQRYQAADLRKITRQLQLEELGESYESDESPLQRERTESFKSSLAPINKSGSYSPPPLPLKEGELYSLPPLPLQDMTLSRPDINDESDQPPLPLPRKTRKSHSHSTSEESLSEQGISDQPSENTESDQEELYDSNPLNRNNYKLIYSQDKNGEIKKTILYHGKFFADISKQLENQETAAAKIPINKFIFFIYNKRILLIRKIGTTQQNNLNPIILDPKLDPKNYSIEIEYPHSGVKHFLLKSNLLPMDFRKIILKYCGAYSSNITEAYKAHDNRKGPFEITIHDLKFIIFNTSVLGVRKATETINKAKPPRSKLMTTPQIPYSDEER